MPEKKSPKIRVYKFAAEINLSSENLIEFLKTKRQHATLPKRTAYAQQRH